MSILEIVHYRRETSKEHIVMLILLQGGALYLSIWFLIRSLIKGKFSISSNKAFFGDCTNDINNDVTSQFLTK